MSEDSAILVRSLRRVITDALPLPEAALLYAKMGWAIFPLGPKSKIPLRGTNGFHGATTEPKVIMRTWAQDPKSNIGFVPGKSLFVVLDIDTEAAEDLAANLGLLELPTLTVKTGRQEFASARHLYFRHPATRHIGNTRVAGVLEVRADSGYVLLPPSIHPSGAIYRFTQCVEPPPLPTSALAALSAPTSRAQPICARDVPCLSSIPEPTRHNYLLSAITRLVALTRGEITASEVFGYAQALNEVRCFPGPIAAEEVWAMVQWACRRERVPLTRNKARTVRLGAPAVGGRKPGGFGFRS